jgi:phosphoglycerol transferase
MGAKTAFAPIFLSPGSGFPADPEFQLLQDVLVASLLLLCMACCLAVILRPTLAPDKPGIVATLALAGAALVGGTDLIPHPHLLHGVLFLGILALVPGVVIARSFRRIDMIAILFHREFGMQGATLVGLKNEIATAVISAMPLLLAILGLHEALKLPESAVAAALGAVLLANPFLRYAALRLWQRPRPSVLRDWLTKPQIKASDARPDLVVVYLEGVDRRFFDHQVFGPITAKLQAYAADGISFTRVGQIAGTGWSLAGMVATQSGVPVAPRGLNFMKRLEEVPVFMPTAPFLTDILHAKGYDSHYVVGGDTEFGGIGPMYRTHRIGRMTGIEEMRGLFPEAAVKAATAGWFLDDQMVLDAALRVHDQLLRKAAPYALIVETIGPHGPRGTISRRWTDSGKTEHSDIPRSVACLVDEVDEFLAQIRATQPADRDLRIVLLSDHLNHSPTVPKTGPAYEGFNTVIFWGAPDRKGGVIDRPGSMVDVFPTLLDCMGWAEAPVAAGIGRSLLSSPLTLVESFGIAEVDRMITGDAGFANQIWDVADCPEPTPRAT